MRQTVECVDGTVDDISVPVLELPTLQPIITMIQEGKSNCVLEDVVLQNGLTTSQVTHTLLLLSTRRFVTAAQ